ncbi:MAG TPA: hypothetical protein PLC90_06070 [Bacteroidales bacterium]|nr:hypothetical protein [Bacteroidales bacterium]
MELKEFVSQTVIQITEGLREGTKYIRDKGYGEGVDDGKGKEINFDVAVTSNEEETTGIGGKINVVNIFSAGGKDETTIKEATVSRIQFRIFLHIKTKE